MRLPVVTVLVPLIVGCAQFMQQLDSTIIATALPVIANSLKEEPLRLNLAITSYLLSLAVFLPISGWMTDRFGTRTIFASAMAVFTIGSMLCGLADSLLFLVLARVVQGAGGAMMLPVGRMIILKTVPKEHLVSAMNWVTIPGVLGPLLGPPLGGFIVTYFSWPWIFFMNLPVGLFGVALILVFVRNIREPGIPRLDMAGFLMVGIGLACLVFGFTTMGRGLLPLGTVAWLLVIGAVASLGYLYYAMRATSPLLDLKMLKVPSFRAGIVGGGLFYMGSTAVPFLLALLFQLGFGLSPLQSGLMTLAVAAGSVVTRFSLTKLLRRFGFRSVTIAGALLHALCLVLCAAFRLGTPYPLMLLALFPMGFARSVSYTALNSLPYIEMQPSMMSRAQSFAAMAQQLFGSFGVGVTALIIHASLLLHGGSGIEAADVSPAFLFIGLLCACCLFIYLRLPPDIGADVSGRGRRHG
jgi:EmrB/QacA subfamily drug resistance transporter